jgi:hypothetical protein
VHCFWVEPNGRLVIAMELAEGNLRERAGACRARGLPGIPLAELLRYLQESAEALDYLHGEGLVHRDIKPANILYVKGHAKVADLGLAKERHLERSLLSSYQSVAGTQPYMAREAWRKATPKSDLFSLAVSYAELRLGEPLHPRGSRGEVWMPVLDEPPDLSGLPSGERRVLERALQHDPEKRPATCLDLALALERAAGRRPEAPGWRLWVLRLLHLGPAPAPATGAGTHHYGADGTQPSDAPPVGPRPAATGFPRGGSTGRPPAEAGASAPTADVPAVPAAGSPYVTINPSPESDPARPPQGAPAGRVRYDSASPPVSPPHLGAELPPRRDAASEGPAADESEFVLEPPDGGLVKERPPQQLRDGAEQGEATDQTHGLPRWLKVVGQLAAMVVVMLGAGGYGWYYRINHPPSAAPPGETARGSVASTGSTTKAPPDVVVPVKPPAPNVAELLARAEGKLAKNDLAGALEDFEGARQAAEGDPANQARVSERTEAALNKVVKLLDEWDEDRARRAVNTILKYRPGHEGAIAQAEALGAIEAATQPPLKPFEALGKIRSVLAGAHPRRVERLCELAAAFGEEGKYLKRAEEALRQGPAAGTSYACYLRALVKENEGPAAAAEEVAKAFPPEGLPPAFEKAQKNEARRKHAAAILTRAASELRERGTWDDPFAGPRNAELAYGWLSKAALLGDMPLAVGTRARLVVAAGFRARPDGDQLRRVTREMIGQPGGVTTLSRELGKDAVPFFLVAAQAHAPNGGGDLETAIVSYDEALRLLRTDQDPPDPEPLYRKVLQPAAALAAHLPAGAGPATKKPVARFQAAVAEMLCAESYSPWAKKEFGDPVEKVLGKAVEAYGKAIDLDPTQPKYFVERGYAASQLPHRSWDRIGEDARGAYRANGDRDFYGSLGLRAYVDLMRARLETDLTKRAKGLRAAVAGYDRAVELLRGAPEDGKDLALLQTSRSTAYTELANVTTDKAERRALLLQAKRGAEDVINGGAGGLEKAYALCALANALEDFAWLLGDDPGKNYEEAVSKFEEARKTLDLPYFRMNKGRALYKWAAYGLRGKEARREQFDKAREAIEALAPARGCPDLALRAEILSWLQKAHALRAEYDEAEAALKEAVDLAKQERLPSRSNYQVDWAELALARGEQLMSRAAPAKKWLEEARIRAKQVADERPLAADRISGRSYFLERDWDRALRDYRAHLPADLAQAKEADYLPLLIGRVDCLIARDPYGILNDQDALELLRACAERAAALADALDLNAASKADAYRTLGNVFTCLADARPGSKQAWGHRLQACREFEKATQLAPSDPHCWEWHRSAANQYIQLTRNPSEGGEKVNEYREKARAHVGQALASPGADKPSLRKYQEYLER